MPLSKYQRFCYRIFGDIAENRVSENLKKDLVKASIDIRAGAYLAYTWMNTIISIVVSLVVMVILFFVIMPSLGIDLFGTSSESSKILYSLLIFLIPFGLGFLTYFLHLTYPKSKAKARGKKIDHSLPYALNFISTMSAAGIAPHEIFISLSKQNIYGEVKEEAARIAKDMTLLGIDIITALKRAIERTPSERFKEFLQGAVVTVTSGGTLKPYFMAKAEQYMRENRQNFKQFLETLGVMAEAYVTAAVAGPLFILIVVVLLSMIRGGSQQLAFMYFFVLLVLPLIHLGFALVIKSMTPEV